MKSKMGTRKAIKDIKMRIALWELYFHTKILDPDGFDRTDPNLYEKEFSHDEAIDGFAACTQKDMTPEEWYNQLCDITREAVNSLFSYH